MNDSMRIGFWIITAVVFALAEVAMILPPPVITVFAAGVTAVRRPPASLTTF